MNYNERCLIVAKTRAGKSTFARYLAALFTGARIFLINVKGVLDVGVPATSSIDAIDWSARVVNFIPTTFDRQFFADLYMAIWLNCRGVPTVVWTDEGAAVTTANYAPDGLLLIQQQGGENGIGHIVCAQRCKNIKMELRTEAEEFFIFVPPASQADLKWLAEEIAEVAGEQFGPDELRAWLRAAQLEHGNYSFLRWVRSTGQLDVCAPLDPAWIDRPLVTPRELAATSRQPTALDAGDVEPAATLDEHDYGG